jgi:epoxyqueuosine reductase
MLTSEAIRQRAREIGFDLCGVAPATSLPELTRLRDWLDKGYAGEMIYLHKSADTRADIRKFLPSARSVIVTGTIYYTDASATGDVDIARYAWGEDYHVVLAERLEALVAWMREQQSEPFEAAVFVDKHHVQERVFAKYAGLGWIGKNTCLINPELGSWLFLAGVATSLDLALDTPLADRCGSCTLCIDSCPTGALVDDYEMDATRCISYLTIELKNAIPEHQRAGVGHHAYGCDVCQEVCPWNLAPLATLDQAWAPQAGRSTANAAELWQRSDQELNGLIRHSAMTRTTLSRLRRNLAVTLGNSGDPAMLGVLDRPGAGVRRAAQSADTPLVQEHIRWAKERLEAVGSRLTAVGKSDTELSQAARAPKAEKVESREPKAGRL